MLSSLNGFDIDKYNVYNIKEGAHKSTCPKCSHTRSEKNQSEKCASVDWERGLLYCHHCEETLQLHEYKRKKNNNVEYVKPTAELTYPTPPKKVLEYFESRGISKETLEALKVTYGTEYMPQENKEVGCIKFNYFMGGELINIQFRDAKKNFKMFKGAELVFYNIDSIVGFDTAIITEGQIDALSMHEAGYKNVVSVPNGASRNLDYLDNCIDYFEDKEKIILAVDNDEKGELLRSELIRRLGAEVCYLVDFKDCKDANEVLTKYGADTLRDIIDNPSPVPLENVYTLKDHMGDVIDFFENGFKEGYTVGLPNLDEIFSTYTSQSIIVTGIRSHGKSDFIDMMTMGYNKRYGFKVAYASPENKPDWIHSSKLIRKAFRGLPDKGDIGSERWSEAVSYINENFYYIDADVYYLEDVLEKGAELVKRKGIRVLVAEPFNKIGMRSMKREEDGYVLEYLNKVEAFCKKYDVITILAAHPIKMFPDQSTGEYPIPTLDHIRGSEWGDAAYHAIAVHRNYQEKTTTVKVLKQKFQHLGQNGAECKFTWDEDSGLFKPYEDIHTRGNYMDSFKGVGDLPWEN